MSTHYFRRSNQQKITLATTPFASGGEGELYQVVAPQGKSWVAKIYHPFKRSAERANKMAYLQQHPPFNSQGQGAWIMDTLEDKTKNFVGILMPFQRGSKLEVLCGNKLPKKIGDSLQALGLGQPFALEGRFHLGLQLAAAVAQLHESQQYVLVDLKPDNVLVQTYRQLSLVDLDSVAVVKQGNLHFAAAVATPEYAPPEYHQDSPALFPSWDNFSLAVILYKLFCGIHPYAATAGAPYEQANSLGEKIKHGLFAHSPSKASFLTVIPPPHQRFKALPKQLQALFLQCFEEGQQYPERRPKASDWCWGLLDVLGEEQLIGEFREKLADGWEHPRQALLFPSTLLLQQKKQKEAWSKVNVPAPLEPAMEYEKGLVLLEQLKKELSNWKNPEFFFVGFAVVCLLLIFSLIRGYHPYIKGVTFLLVVYLMRRFFVFCKQLKKRAALKKVVQQYHQQQQQAALQKAGLTQDWQLWKEEQEGQVKLSLEQLAVTIHNKDAEVQQLLQKRLKVYQEVLQNYQEKLKELNVPKQWQGFSWAAIVQQLEQQKIAQEQALEKAMGSPAIQQTYQEELDTAEQQLQQLEQQLLDEARVLFDWEDFFDAEETGIAWKTPLLLQSLEGAQVPNLLAIQALTWTSTGGLQGQTDKQTFLLEKKEEQQLELFYEAYQLYKAPLEFAREQGIQTAPDFLRARFSALHQEYQEQLEALRLAHQTRQQAHKIPQQQALLLTKWQLEQLEELIVERQQALVAVESTYQQLYQPIQEEVEQYLGERLHLLTQFKENSIAYWEQLQEENSLVEVDQLLKKQVKEIKHLL